MINIRRSEDRGFADHGWLKARHTFSFADYHDPKFMNYRSLRVINEDRIDGGQGFGRHPHKDMEIITYVVSGALKHQDSMGHEGIIEAGQVQKMTAGAGVTHSEFNASTKDEVHLLQIWITPQEKNLTPSYQQHDLPANQENCLLPLPVAIHQDVKIFRGRFCVGHEFDYQIGQGRGLWLQVIEGQLKIGTELLNEGDGASIEGSQQLTAKALHQTEFLLFDLK
jgi:hypothetical protein